MCLDCDEEVSGVKLRLQPGLQTQLKHTECQFQIEHIGVSIQDIQPGHVLYSFQSLFDRVAVNTQTCARFCHIGLTLEVDLQCFKQPIFFLMTLVIAEKYFELFLKRIVFQLREQSSGTRKCGYRCSVSLPLPGGWYIPCEGPVWPRKMPGDSLPGAGKDYSCQ